MSNSFRDSELDTCGCSESEEEEREIYNRPGLSELRYRIGTHGTFLQRMISLLHRQTIPDGENAGTRPLEALTTRESDDPAIALLDAWAVVADVLTFYEERIANEGYLRTAAERRSVMELARAIGYELNPGVAAGTYLAFTVEDAPGAPGKATIPEGTQVQSIPGQDELPQTFETAEDLEAKKEWNDLRPRLTRPQYMGIWNDAEAPKLYLIDIEGFSSAFAENVITEDQFDSLYMVYGSLPEGLGQVWAIEVKQIYIQGITSDLDPGNLLLMVGQNGSGDLTVLPKRIHTVETNAESDWTVVEFITDTAEEEVVGEVQTTSIVPAAGQIIQKRIALNAENVRTYITERVWTEADLSVFLEIQGWVEADLLSHVASLADGDSTYGEKGVFALREKLGFFGHNAPDYYSLPDPDEASIIGNPYPYDWDENGGLDIWHNPAPEHKAFPGSREHNFDPPYYEEADVYLERTISDDLTESWVVFEASPDQLVAYRVCESTERSIVGFGLSVRVTGLRLEEINGAPLSNKPGNFKVRKTTAHVVSEQLELAQLPVGDDISAETTEITLDGMALYLQEGQAVALTGEQADGEGIYNSEILVLDRIVHSNNHTTLHFTQGLQYNYIRDTVTINANVARATHGETVAAEVLGSGDASVSNQSFVLKKPPLTYVSAATPSGSESTLEARVNDVLWEEARSLYGLDADSESYIVRIDNDANATVIFGDGESGARLPSGTENLVAKYRSGIGPDGEVDTGSLTLLKTRPLGVREVTNPLPASGAEAPEELEDARGNAPLTVLALDRIVSLQDFENFARAFAGIGKAQAVDLWSGEKRIVHITIAAANGDEVDTTSDLYNNLRDAIDAAKDPVQEVSIGSYDILYFNVSASVIVDSHYVPENVITYVEEALQASFSFDERDLGQPVSAAEVVSIIHEVDGVIAVDLDELYIVESEESGLKSVLMANTAHWVKGYNDIKSAELLLINSAGITLEARER